ncbi:hypothetical protein KXV57_007460 [Aspergillus fumigatus]|uniref:Dihydrodipicolinate synthetase family protein n=1 Tax=Aspergillus fumigatus TaxID=746128 RepID=A0A9P8NQN6_ASPFM|nr:hypothetical protein KXV57_007460 [Aspergillus fumigatus]
MPPLPLDMASTLVPEIIIQILNHFETVEEVVVIWTIAQRQILAFNDALMAVRATKIVLESFEKEELPPDPFPLSTLSGAVRKPSISEFQQVRDFEHLAKCAEQIFVEEGRGLKDEIRNDQPDGATLWVRWRERFHSSIYRVLLAGAILSRAYQEPMYFAAEWGLPNFLEKYVEALASGGMSGEPVGGDELDYLVTFAPYNLGESGRIHGSFRALGEFFVQQGKTRAHQSNLHEQTTAILPPFAAPQALSRSEAAVVFVELGQLFFALEVLTGIQDRQPIIVNGDGSDEHGRTRIAPDLLYKPARTTPVVLFGTFFPEYIAMGVDIDAETLVSLAEQPNLVGCKLTCNDMGKLNRLVAAVRPATAAERGSGFMCFGGSADATLQTLVGGGSGVVAGLANIAPKACVRLVELYHLGEMEEARRLQGVVARADRVANQGGVGAVKSALRVWFGYGGYARRPLRGTEEEEKRESGAEGLKEVVELEKRL